MTDLNKELESKNRLIYLNELYDDLVLLIKGNIITYRTAESIEEYKLTECKKKYRYDSRLYENEAEHKYALIVKYDTNTYRIYELDYSEANKVKELIAIERTLKTSSMTLITLLKIFGWMFIGFGIPIGLLAFEEAGILGVLIIFVCIAFGVLFFAISEILKKVRTIEANQLKEK